MIGLVLSSSIALSKSLIESSSLYKKVKISGRRLKYLLSRVSVATGPIMPVNCILFVEINGCREVTYRLIILKESIPDKSPAIVSGCVLRVKLYDFVKVFKSKVQSIATNLLSYCAKMMNSLHIRWLQLNCLQVILFSFL